MSFGFKAAQPGYDVKKSPDSKMAASSEWQSLRIAFEGNFTLPANDSTPKILFNHNFGYVPFFWVFMNDDYGAGTYPDDISRFWNTFDPDIVIDETSIKAPAGGVGVEMQGRYIVFENPMIQDYEADINIRGVGESINIDKYGVRAALNNKDIKSDDKRDLTLDTTTRTPLVHRVKNGMTTAFADIIIQHELGELPEYFVFAKLSGNNYWQIVTSANDSFIQCEENSILVSLNFNCEYSIWILKQSIVRD